MAGRNGWVTSRHQRLRGGHPQGSPLGGADDWITRGRTAIVSILQGLNSLVAVALVAALTPLVVALLPGPRIPQVVIFLLGGVLIGPHVLGLADTGSIQLLSNIGLGFLFLLAGYELDPLLLRQRPGRLAIAGWLMSAVISVAVTAGLTAVGYIK